MEVCLHKTTLKPNIYSAQHDKYETYEIKAFVKHETAQACVHIISVLDVNRRLYTTNTMYHESDRFNKTARYCL